MQDADLFTKHPPNNEQRLDQYGQLGEVIDELFDPRVKLDRPDHAHLETEVAQGGAQVVLNGDGFRLQQPAVGQQHPQFLAAQRLYMDGTIKPICAMPRASLRSVLLTCAFNAARICRVSTQITGKPASARVLNSHCDSGPASNPIRLKW